MMHKEHETIISKDNSLIKKIVKLANDSSYRHDSKMAVIYGAHLVEEAIRYNILDTLILQQSSYSKYQSISKVVKQVKLVSHDVMRKINVLETATDILGLIKIGMVDLTEEVYTSDCILLDNISDPGNLGAIFRVAQASGIKDVLLSQGCVDPYNPKVLRASQGIQFGLAINTKVNLKDFIKKYNGTVIATSSSAKESLYNCNLTNNKMAWLFGNEGAGLSQDLLDYVPKHVAIPLKGNAESLNVTIAAAVCLFEMVRQKEQVKL